MTTATEDSPAPAHPDLVFKCDRARNRATHSTRRARYIATLVASREPMTGEAVARAVNDDALTVAYRLAPLRRMGYVEHAGHDKHGLVLWISTSRGDALFQAMRHL